MRINADLWVMSYVRRLNSDGAPAFVVKRGDEHSGSIFIRINALDGTSDLYGPAAAGITQVATERCWTLRKSGDDQTIDEILAREAEYDPDIWLIEVEDRQRRHFLDQGLISS
ncbi:MAG: DUF1491 family protein [Filomicrobium sp.]